MGIAERVVGNSRSPRGGMARVGRSAHQGTRGERYVAGLRVVQEFTGGRSIVDFAPGSNTVVARCPLPGVGAVAFGIAVAPSAP